MPSKKKKGFSAFKEPTKAQVTNQLLVDLDGRVAALSGASSEIAKRVEEQRQTAFSIQATLARILRIVDSPEDAGSFIEKTVSTLEHRVIQLEGTVKTQGRILYLLVTAFFATAGIAITAFFSK
jgi:hypothetical protein